MYSVTAISKLGHSLVVGICATGSKNDPSGECDFYQKQENPRKYYEKYFFCLSTTLFQAALDNL